MKYAVKQQTHIYDLIYPFAAKLLGMKSFSIRDDANFKVKFHANRYCGHTDTYENIMHKITVECDFGKYGTVFFIPSPLFGDTVFTYTAYVDDEPVAKLGPYEWEVIRPKTYSDFSEYFTEFSKAIDAMQYLTSYKIAHPFILEHYVEFFQKFREILYSKISGFEGEDLPHAVSFVFNSSGIYGKSIKEQAFVSRDLDNRMTLHVSSLN